MSMVGAHVRSRAGEGFGRGRRFGVFRLFLAGCVSASLLSAHVCSVDLRLAGQTAHSQAPGGFRLCIHIMSMLKVVHSPRRAVSFVRISFEKLTNPRVK